MVNKFIPIPEKLKEVLIQLKKRARNNMKKILTELTAYYPSDEGVEGGYLDALGKPLYPNYPTCAALLKYLFTP